MALYYTLDEFTETLHKELRHLTTYIQMLGYIRSQESFHIKAGVHTSSQLGIVLEFLLVDADTNLEEIETKLTVGSNVEIDFTKYAHEARVGALVFGASNPGHYHHAKIDVEGDFSKWTITAHDSEEGTVDAFDSVTPTTGATGLYLVDDIVEIMNLGDPYLEGFFTVVTTGTSAFALVEANANEVVDIDPAYNIVVRLRER